ncbi:MAG: hypothetical protein N4A49_03460 [Marinifilaceae bacterium]|jgi:hypothetical protein|nr:hypothetical protein [Marinifilaceae bacterium]
MNKDQFLKKYQDFNISKSLTELIEFSIEKGSFFSDGFEFEPENIKYMYESYSFDKEFIESFMCIGSADGMGSEYAFWLKDGNDLTNVPIVAFGGEGGYHIIAKNFDELIRILTFDSEPMIDWDGIEFYKDQGDFEASQNANEFHDWVKTNLKLEIIDSDEDIYKIISEAKEIYQTELKEWVSKFYEE